jgi:hypothetical protein
LACSLLCNVYNLVIYYRRNVSEGCLAVGNTVLQPTLEALISLNYLRLQVVSLLCNKLLRTAEYALALAAHSRHCEEVVSHGRERWIEVFTAFTLPTERLYLLLDNLPYSISSCNIGVKGIVHEALELALL